MSATSTHAAGDAPWGAAGDAPWGAVGAAPAVRKFLAAGFGLIPFARGTKGPSGKEAIGWNQRVFARFGEAKAVEFVGKNAGLAHAWSRTCALDVDDFNQAADWLAAHGIELEALLMADDAVQVRSPRRNRAKLLYRLPEGVELPRTQMLKQGGETFLEFRCATSEGQTVQDVIDGTHPDGGEYRLMGDPAAMPEIPPALLDAWREIDDGSSRESRPFGPNLRGTVAVTRETLAELRSALGAIPSDDRGLWVRLGLALATLGEPGRELWLEWSRTSSKFNAEDAERVWRSLVPRITSSRVVFAEAQRRGWRNPLAGRSESRQEPANGADGAQVPGADARAQGGDSGALAGDTEDALAREFVERNGDDFKFVPGYGFMLWDGTRWARDLKRRHFDAMRRIARERAEGSKPNDRRRIASAKTVAAMASLASSDPAIVRGAAELDADPWLLNTPGGLVDLRTRQVRPHARALVTKVAAVAPDFRARCTAWHAFLDGVFTGNAEVVAFAKRLLGYCLTGLTREHVVGFFFGDGANGKSTLLDLLLWLLGDYALKLPATVLMAQKGERHPTELAQLVGVRLAIASELDEGAHWAEARLKELTGDATLTARYVRGDFFTFPLLCKIVIGGNHRPQMRAVDDALKRRLLLVPFTAKFTGDRRDPRMLERLKAEAPGILAWLIDGCAEWQANGLQVPESIRAASDDYTATMDSLGNWTSECCELNLDASASSSRLYRSFSDWKRTRGESVMSQTRWGEQMRGRGFERFKASDIRYRGVDLTAAEDERIRMADFGKASSR